MSALPRPSLLIAGAGVLALAACGSAAAPRRTPVSSTAPAGAAADVRPIVRDPSAPSTCGKLATTLAAEAPLLADRLRLRVPAGVDLSPRPYNIMSAPMPLEEETRVMIGGGASAGQAPGDGALVILAHETWQLDPERVRAEADAPVRPGSLDEEARKHLRAATGDEGLAVERVRVADATIRVYAGRPTAVTAEAGDDAALVFALLVVLPDATIQTIGFYVSPELAPQPGCVHFAERIADTLSIGPRKLVRGGVRAIHEVSPAESLTVTLPADHVVVHQPGPDFDTYRIYRLRPLGLFPGGMFVSVDAYADRDVPPDTVPEQGTLLGRPVTWHVQRRPTGGKMTALQPLVPGKPSDERLVKVTIIATRQAKVLDELRRVAESLAVVPRGGGSTRP